MRSRGGFTLVELLIALGLLVLGMTGIYSVFLAATRQHARAVDSTNAAAASLAMLESVRSQVALDPAFDLSQKPTGAVPGMPGYSYSLRFQRLDAGGRRVLIELELRWKRRSADQVHIFRSVALRRHEPRGR